MPISRTGNSKSSSSNGLTAAEAAFLRACEARDWARVEGQLAAETRAPRGSDPFIREAEEKLAA
jgi:hypothetical protein